MESRTDRLVWSAVAVSLAVKLVLAAAIPITSDEAYFTIWGRHVALGYYDHPPMVGWLLFLVSFLGDSPVVVRLPAVLSTVAIALGVRSLLRPLDERKAALTAVFLLVSPLNVLNVFITTDTPFLIFSFLSACLLFRALQRESYPFYALSGAALGAAFLSKYFAVLLGLAYAAYVGLSRKEPKKTRGFLLLLLSAVPAVALNVVWNYNNCWANIMFNLFNRTGSESFSLAKVLSFLATQAYLVSPAVVYHLARRRGELRANLSAAWRRLEAAGYGLFAFAFAAPLLLFALLSVKKTVGLHWVLGFYPFLYLLLFFVLTEDEMVGAIRFTVVFTLIHLALAGALLSVPLRYFQASKHYSTLVMVTKPGEIRKHLDRQEGTFVLATPSYAASALLTYHLGTYVIVFGGGSHHGRQDDFQTDFGKLDGKDVLVVRSSEPKPEEYAGFFRDVSHERILVDGAQFHLVRGRHFIYRNYRDRVLKEIGRKYYDIPPWLPVSPDCGFLGTFRTPEKTPS